MNCTCKCWEHKHITIKCHKCDGLTSYVRTENINEEDEKELILKKIKNQIINKEDDIFILKMQMRELESDISDLELKGC